jgi:hypothetical protein
MAARPRPRDERGDRMADAVPDSLPSLTPEGKFPVPAPGARILSHRSVTDTCERQAWTRGSRTRVAATGDFSQAAGL